MLAYVFWHRPRRGVEPEEYEKAQRAFHSRLEAPSASFRLERFPFREADGGNAPGRYEDWYLVAGWKQLGELNAGAVDERRRPDHDAAAALAGAGWGAVYASVRGPAEIPREARWLSKPPGEELEAVLGDVAPNVPIWQRQLVLGPAPEICVGAGGSSRRSVIPLSSRS